MRKWLSLIFVSIFSLFVLIQAVAFNVARCAVSTCRPAIQFILRPELVTVSDPLGKKGRAKRSG